MLKNGVDIGPHQIIQSDEDEDDVPAYGFPSQKRRNRVQQSDLELEFSKGGELWKRFFHFFFNFFSLHPPPAHSHHNDLSIYFSFFP